MKVLQLHVDYIEFEPIKKEIDIAEETEKKVFKIENCLALLISIEKNDNESFIENLIEEAENTLKNLGIKKIVLYPYAHLSKELAPPLFSLELFKKIEEKFKEKNLEVYKAPFGWTKRLTLAIKGHPLAEQLKIIKEGKIETKKIEKNYFVLTKSLELIDAKNYDLSKVPKEFKILVEQEAFGKSSNQQKEPKYLKLMKRFGINWEGFSDLGHMRYGPLGSFILDMLSEYVSSIVSNLPFPVYFVKGTNMFNLKEKAIAEHASLFGQRMYQVDTENRQLVLRYAACFQQFSMAKDWQISYKNLPFGMFEIADSYRFEQSGELLLSFRTRKLLMPDLHVFCKDLEQAKEIFLILHEKIHEEMEKLGKKYYSLYNLTSKKFLNENKYFFKKLLERENFDVLICSYPENANYYWILNIEYHIIDELERAREIGTVQIDVGNAKRFGIKYIDENGNEKYPIILHCAILGSLERFLYTIFDNLAKSENPKLPLWLAPMQVRIIPVSDKYLDEALRLAIKFRDYNVRIDIDDRSETVQRKIRDAETSLINYMIVLGEKEIKEKVLTIREKGGKMIEMKFEDFIKRLNEEMSDYPKEQINLPILLSKRPHLDV